MLKNEVLGKRILDARRKKCWTQDQLAKKVGVHKQAVSNWERGKNRIDEEIKEKLEEVLEINLSRPNRKMEFIDMKIKALDEIITEEELLKYVDQIVDMTPVDSLFSFSVKELLKLTLIVVLGYELYAQNEEREAARNAPMEYPDYDTTLDWGNIAFDLSAIFNSFDFYPMPAPYNHIDMKPLYQAKIECLSETIGEVLFEDLEKDGFCYDVGRLAYNTSFDLLRILPSMENSLLSSFKISILHLASIVDDLEE
jgi:transcriptional regulator with XRE-family HTH domain